MAARIPIPQPLRTRPFSVREGHEHGLSANRMRTADLERPLRGVRTTSPPTSRIEFLRAAAVRLRPWQALTGSSAAVILGLPLPSWGMALNGPVRVAVELGHSVPRAEGFLGIRITPNRFATTEIDGLLITDAMTTWCTLARELTVHDLVAVGDSIISESRHTSRRGPAWTIEALAAQLPLWRGSVGIAKVREALPLLRGDVDSRMETLLRLAIVDAGFPEPVVHPPVVLVNGRVVHPDLGYPSLRLGFEYEGAHHTDHRRVLADIARFEDFADVGWSVMRITRDDIVHNPHQLFRRIADRIDRQRRILGV